MDHFTRRLALHVPRLRRYARALAGNAAEADDLVQDCLERAWRHARQWREAEDMRPWLFAILHNVFVSGVRRRVRGPRFATLEEVPEPVAGGDSRPEGVAALRDLERALGGLRDEQREVLLLVALEGLSYEEAAAVLDIPLGTVMSRLYRAREQLRRQLTGEETMGLRRIK
ncbi:RNA polymerase sigma factor [Thioalbus denitrificans]|uniref:RNA polymerase sigma-70 factor (ECF subfamily) n=1 Tax=Thioalbus denitrificans TaxID=547122 RepID=A0A369C9N0_9GAMM|nr:RNA polymerase sigma factor [Thioalbus denitrificans]RCX30740.1 RNA polymerase sigma-70 factor (ECF subfamily) [Thioalbus denitrificans]